MIYVFLLSVLVLSCEKDDTSISQSSITENDVYGSWKVTYLEHADVSELATYIFEFEPNNVLLITKGGNDTSGAWKIMEGSGDLKILIPEKEYPLRTMHSVWKVNSASTEHLQLSEMESEHDYLEKSEFTRL